MTDVEVIEKEVDKTDTTLTPQEKAEAEARKAEEEAKVNKSTESEQELDLDGLVKLEDGGYELQFGNSIYRGKTIKEVIANAQKGVAEKDKAFHELRAKEHIRVPDDVNDEVEVPEQPVQSEFIKQHFQQRGLDPKMLRWESAQWKQYAADKELDEFDLRELRDSVKKAYDSAMNQFDKAEVGWFNKTTLHKKLTPAVQRMVASSGLDAEQFGATYLRILKDPKYTQDGILQATDIIEAMHEEILKSVKPQKESALAKKTAEEKAKLEDKKKVLSSARTETKTQVNDKSPINIKEASRRALAMLQ